ncbi:MAG: VWA domain-containing protein, partial [Deltaproteobacteria bacterium]|nr:VWA domain-containing protein [Deltaproteobacteria bacterium]
GEILRIQSITLLMIRICAILFLVLAFAKPNLVIEKAISAQSGDSGLAGVYGAYPSSTAIIIDDSFSMRYRRHGKTLFAAAVEEASSIIRSSHPHSEFLIIFSGSPGSRAGGFGSGRGELLRTLRKKKAGFGAADLNDSIRAALGEFPGGRFGIKRMVIISDFREASFAPGGIPPISEDIAVDILDVSGGEFFSNAGITGVSIQNAADISPQHMKADISVGNFSKDKFIGQASIEVDEKVSKIEIEGEGWSEIKRGLVVKTEAKDFVKGKISVSGDNLPEDDEGEFFYDMKQRLNILILNGSMRSIAALDEAFYIEKALKTLRTRLRINTVSIVRPELFSPVHLERIDILICLNAVSLKDENISEIKRFVRDGGSLLITAGDNVSPERYNRVFDTLLPYPLREMRFAGGIEGEMGTRFKIEKMNAGHPVFSPFKPGADGGLREALFTGYVIPGFSGNMQSEVLAALTGGYPLLTEKTLGNGKVMFYHSTFDRDWSDLALRPAWITFVEQVVKYLSKGEWMEEDIEIGSVINLPAGSEISGITVVKPDGNKTVFGGETIKQSKNVIFNETDLPGVYEVVYHFRQGEVKKTGFSVRIPAGEMNLSPADPRFLVPLSKAGKDAGSNHSGTIAYRIPLSNYSLLALVLLLLCETAVTLRKIHG